MSEPSPSLEDRLCVVTGAGGFIGSHLVEALLARGARVRALVHYNALGSIGHLAEAVAREMEDGLKPALRTLEDGLKPALRTPEDGLDPTLGIPEDGLEPAPQTQGRLEITAGDIRDTRCMRNLVKGAYAVFHLAALIGIPYSYAAPESYVDTNVRGTLNVLEACREAGVGRILHTSTSEVYGSSRYVPMDERHPLQAQSPYAATKIAGDKLAESYALSYNLPVTTVRPFNAYGPRQSLRAIVPTVLAQALSSVCERIEVGALHPVRDLTFVEDVARAFCEIATAPLETVRGRLYNLGTGRGVTIAELAELAQKAAGVNKPIVEMADRKRPDASEVQRLVSDPSRVEREVGWKAAISLEEGLRRTAEYLRRNPPDPRALTQYAV